MEALFYLDIATKRATESLGGGAFKFPTLYYGEEATIGIRFSQKVGTKTVEAKRGIQELRATIGRVDYRPETGKIALKVGDESAPSVLGVNVTEAFEHNASAKKVADKINALSIVGEGETYGNATVEIKHGSWIVIFKDSEEAVPIRAFSNSLFPLSFLRVRASEFNNQFEHDLRLIQAPVADTDQSARVVPPAPSIETIEDGGEGGEGAKFVETQHLFIPPTFRGIYVLRRGYLKTRTLDRNDGHVEVGKACNSELLSSTESGPFLTSLPTDNTIEINFTGDLAGINHDPLQVEVVKAPEGDLTFSLNLDTPELHALLRQSEKVTLPLEIEADVEDENDPNIVKTRKLFRTNVTIERSVRWKELSTAASIDWLRPPLPKDYKPFSTTQISNGQLHYAVAVGNDSLDEFAIDHNLDLDRMAVFVNKNTALGEPAIYGTDYTYQKEVGNPKNAMNFTFTETPEQGEWLITILGLELTSYFDPHTHPIGQIEGLQAIIDDFGSRINELERRSGKGVLPSAADDDEIVSAQWQLPDYFEAFPSRQAVTAEGERLIDIPNSSLGKERGLLPAVHDAEVEALPIPLPTAADEYRGRVFRNETGDKQPLTGGQGIRSAYVANGGFAACDGRLWYPVARYGDHFEGHDFQTDYENEDTVLDSPSNELPAGVRVNVSTTDTLPAPLQPETDYEIFDRDGDKIQLSAVGGDSAIVLTDNGTGTHTIEKAVESTYYPLAFERELFKIHINEKQLRLKKFFELRFAIELAVLKANTDATWTLAIEVGEKVKTESPATTGANLEQIIWRGTPILEQGIAVMPISTVHRFGVRVKRELIDAVDTLTASRILYGGQEGALAPNSANFALRARLIRFDTADNRTDLKGVTLVKGFTVATTGNENLQSEGTAYIQ